MFEFDFTARTASLPDDGINPFPASTLTTLAKVVVTLFINPSLISNRFYHISDGVLTQRDMLSIVEVESGVKWDKTSFSIAATRDAAVANIQNGTFGAVEFKGSLLTPFFGGLQVWTHVDNEVLGVGPREDLREEVVRLIRKRI